jgi:hypothetical protein
MNRVVHLLGFCLMLGFPAVRAEPIVIGDRLEPLVDEALVERFSGGARLELHHPTPGEVVFETDAPWEGNVSAFQSVFRDGPIFRMYYRGLHYSEGGLAAKSRPDHAAFLCYAESDDGIHWRRPELGLFEFQGSKKNNIVLMPVAEIKGDPAHSVVMRDDNPKTPPEARYKLIIRGYEPKNGLYVMTSGDGLRFTLASREPIQTDGTFDSQNLAFWDPVRQTYWEYHRGMTDGVRDIRASSSKDIMSFPAAKRLEFPAMAQFHLYTNQVQPYFRAPHIFIGFPVRYADRGFSDSTYELPDPEDRLARAVKSHRFGTAVTDSLFMSSRDGFNFKRWDEAFLRPGPNRPGAWVYGTNFIFWGLLETHATEKGAPSELSLYATESYRQGTSTRIRRHTLRVDGFVSVNAPYSGGEILTRPLIFKGGNLALNMSTSAAGSVQVELQDASGKPIEGYRLADAPELFGDSVRHIVRWKRGGDLRALEGKPVRLRFVMKDADLYSFQFVPWKADPVRPEPPPLPPKAP